MARYEDVSLDPAVEEAILNIKQAIRTISYTWEWAITQGFSIADDVAGAQADLEQAVRFLTGKEDPS